MTKIATLLGTFALATITGAAQAAPILDSYDLRAFKGASWY